MPSSPEATTLSPLDSSKVPLPCKTFAEALAMQDQRAVGIYIRVNEISSINIREQTARLDFMLIYLARDTQFTEEEDPYALKIVFQNRVGSMESLAEPFNKELIDEHGNKWYFNQQSLIGDFRVSTSRHMNDFPFDSHDVIITALLSGTNANLRPNSYFIKCTGIPGTTSAWMTNIADLEKDEGWVRNIEVVNNDWDVYPGHFVRVPRNERRVEGCFQLGFRVRRKAAYYIQNGFFMVFVLFSINFTSFGILLVEPGEVDLDALTVSSSVSSRNSIIVTVTLTIVALKFALSEKMPGTSPNWLDAYLNFAVLCCLVMMAIFASYTSNELLMAKNDNIVFAVTFTAWYLFCACFFITVARKASANNAHITQKFGRPLAKDVAENLIMHYIDEKEND